MTTEAATELPFTSEDWEKLCAHFQDSVMADTPLTKLALDIGKKWPIRGKGECPRKYTVHTLDELRDLTEFYGKGNRLGLLYSILKEVQTYDVPFSEMADQFDGTKQEDNDAFKTLEAIGVPQDLPIVVVQLSKQVYQLCEAEGIRTIGQLLEFSQRSAQSVVVGGEFQELLNALIQFDVAKLKRFLPLREGQMGLNLSESIRQIASKLTDAEAAGLLRTYKIQVENPAWANAQPTSKLHQDGVVTYLKHAFKRRLELMPDQAASLRQAVQSGEAACIRYFAHINDPDMESLCLAITKLGLDVKVPGNALLRMLRK